MTSDNTILSRWLTLLGVRHTGQYTDARFGAMAFPSLFGLSTLMREYRVATHGYRIDDKRQIGKLTTPFIAPVDKKFVIVTAIDNGTLHYNSAGLDETIAIDEFIDAWSGVAFVAEPTSESIEPDYSKHRFAEAMVKLRNIGIVAIAVMLLGWLFATRGDTHVRGSEVMIAVDLFGLWLSYMLVGKDLGIKSRRSDAVCNVLEAGGCDRITKSDASTFLGIFHWSEVGLTYFSVSIVALIMFPHTHGWLAAINICALPYTIWSITYQKFKAKTWCTMCVGVQLTLWLQFIVTLSFGWIHDIFPLTINTGVLVLTYVLTLLCLNKLNSFIKARKQ